MDELELLFEGCGSPVAEFERRGDGGGRGIDGTRVLFEVILSSVQR